MKAAIPAGTDAIKENIIVAWNKINGFDLLGSLFPAGKTPSTAQASFDVSSVAALVVAVWETVHDST